MQKITYMENTTEQKVIDNLKDKLIQKRLEQLDKSYVYAIEETVRGILPLTPYVYKEGNIYKINTAERIVEFYPPAFPTT